MTILQANSRYAQNDDSASIGRLPQPDGRTVRYRLRRFLPQGADIPTVGEVTVQAGERLDNIAYRSFGDTEQAWRIADANNAMRPQALLAELGRRLAIPLPQAETGWPAQDTPQQDEST
ncbi:LysM domain-containing protein [Ferrovibrio xuzhouensis]|uniref:LysM domain-containing protein n=1 Tax=Ferrovibrio xuzhouensis TaxID=1576914 RepID=A0ABV7VIU5_9PROT